VTQRWLEHSRRSLEQFFDPATALIVDALIEGLTLHQALDDRPYDPHLAAAAVQRVTSDIPAAASVRPSKCGGPGGRDG
jgi:DNA-binding transcriptional regulator YbjK